MTSYKFTGTHSGQTIVRSGKAATTFTHTLLIRAKGEASYREAVNLLKGVQNGNTEVITLKDRSITIEPE